MKTNMNLLTKLFITIILTFSTANANCTGGACMASLDFLTPSTKNVKKTTAPVVVKNVNIKMNALSFNEASVAVQVGIFNTHTKATVSAKKYKLAGDQFRTEIFKTKLNNKTVYKVRVKGFESRNEANLFAASYRNIGAFLVAI